MRASSARSTSRTRSTSTRARAPSSPCSSARSSATGSSRATTTSTRSSRTRRRSQLREHAGALQAAPGRGAARARRRRLPRLLGPVGHASRPSTRGCAGSSSKAFTPRRVAALEPQIRELTRAMIDRFARPRRGRPRRRRSPTSCPALVIFRLLGIPDADVPRVKEWAREPRLPELRRRAGRRAGRATPRTSCATGATASSSSRRASGDAAATTCPATSRGSTEATSRSRSTRSPGSSTAS